MKLAPHDYVPSCMHQGDCAVCGHLQDSPIHYRRDARDQQKSPAQGRADDRDQLYMWIVYDHPRDDPEHYVARRWKTLPDAVPLTDTIRSKSLTDIRVQLSLLGLVKLARMPEDDPVILETWL